MDPIKKILAIIDPTTGPQPCVQKAGRLALATGAQLELFICDFASDLRPSRYAVEEVYEVALAQRRAQLEAQLEALAEPLRKQGLRVVTGVAFEDTLHFGILDKVLKSSPDVVFKDTHYHSAIRRALFTNTDWHLIRECPAPLLLTKPAVWRPLVKLSAAVDPGHIDDKPATLDRELLACTEYLASCLHGDVSAVHVFDPLPVLANMAPIGVATGAASYADGELLRTLREQHEADFKAVLAEYPAFSGHAELLDGAPTTVLPEYVYQQEIDVVVMGAVARRALQRLLVGSTAERLLDRLPCDILVLKPSRLRKEMEAVRSAA
jgi:universal stress protein E